MFLVRPSRQKKEELELELEKATESLKGLDLNTCYNQSINLQGKDDLIKIDEPGVLDLRGTDFCIKDDLIVRKKDGVNWQDLSKRFLGSGFNNSSEAVEQRNLFEKVNFAISKRIEDVLVNDLGLIEKKCYIDSSLNKNSIDDKVYKSLDEVYYRIFISKGALNNPKKLLVLIPNFKTRCWQWTSDMTFNSSFKEGSFIGYVEYFLNKGYEILIANPNENDFLNGAPTYMSYPNSIPIPNSANFDEHIQTIFRDVIFPSKPAEVSVICHIYGASAVCKIINTQFDSVMKMIHSVAMIDSIHSIKELSNYEKKAWVVSNVFNWMKSNLPKLDLIRDLRLGCNCISTGSYNHHNFIPELKEDIFDFFSNHSKYIPLS